MKTFLQLKSIEIEIHSEHNVLLINQLITLESLSLTFVLTNGITR